jgi:hypothetical protein
VRAGDVPVLDRSELRDRYQQFATTARALLADFREVEVNFRALDRDLRERIAAWDGSKGGLLDDVVGSRRSIQDSDQGRTFHAFYDFLLSADRQAEFAELLAGVQALPEVDVDTRLSRIHHDWLDACERTQATVRQLSDQLRRFLDDQVWLESRRVSELLRRIEAAALALRDDGPPRRLTTTIDATRPQIMLPMERPMYSPSVRATIDSTTPKAPEVEQLDVAALFDVVHVEVERLAGAVRQALQREDQVGLDDVLADRPLEQGLAELVAYLGLEDPDFEVVFDPGTQRCVAWTDEDGIQGRAHLPAVTYVRRLPGLVGAPLPREAPA